MSRFLCGLLVSLTLAGVALAQGSKYTPVQGGTRDPEALKKLAAMLGSGGQQQPDQKMMDILNKWLKDTENKPEERQRMIDLARQQAQDNPQQFQKNNPNITLQPNQEKAYGDLRTKLLTTKCELV